MDQFNKSCNLVLIRKLVLLYVTVHILLGATLSYYPLQFVRYLMFLHIAGGEIAFPNFKDFMNSDGPFQLSYPDANLQPTKFAINDEARNFPKEAIERLGEGQKAKEKADKTLKTISGPISNIGAQFKPKNITQPVLISILKPEPFGIVAASNNYISVGKLFI